MAVLAVAGVGAAVGLGVGAAAGLTTFAALATAASIGFSIGTMVGNLLFPEQVKQEGSRLNDLTVSSSAFGQVRPIIYGQVRIAGNVIWATPIQEVKTTQKHGKGGSGPSVTSTTYTYFGTFALALCEGPVEAVLRIWADSKLIYDAVGRNLLTDPIFPFLPAWAQQRIIADQVKFRFYPGDEDQLPDSIIQADKGTENVPAYRGTCYIVFDNLPLADYGNRLPNITCEVVKTVTPAYPYQVWTPESPDSIFGSDTHGHSTLGIDWDRNLVYWQGQNPYGLVVADAVTLRTVRETPMTDVLTDGTDGGIQLSVDTGGIFVGPDGALYFQASHHIVRVDQNTLKQTAEFPAPSGAVVFTDTAFSDVRYFASISAFDTTGARKDFLVVAGFFGYWGVLTIPDLLHIDHGSGGGAGNPRGAVTGKIDLGTGDAWILWGTSTIDRIRYGGGGFTVTTFIITPDMVDSNPAAIGFTGSDWALFLYDESDDSLIFTCRTSAGIISPLDTFIVKWSEPSGVIWSTKLPTSPASPMSSYSRISNGTIGIVLSDKLVMVNTATGAIMLEQNVPPGPPPRWPITMLNSIQAYDSITQVILGYWNGAGGVPVPGGFAKAFIGRGDGEVTTLGEIVSDQCMRAGFVPADFDASELTDTIQGYVISQRATVTDVLTPLLAGFLSDAVETDYTLIFKHRGGATVANVAQDDLIRADQESAEPYVETRQQEIELPMRLTITYMDKDRDYQVNTAVAKRIRNPDPTVFSDNQIDVQFAVVMTSTPAKQMAEQLLFSAWNERHTFAARLSPTFDYLDPADVVQLTLKDGYTARTRLGNTSLGVDYSLEAKLIGETDGQYISTAEADPGIPWFGSHFIKATGKSELILLDTPLLRDVDDMAGRAIRGYWAGGPFSRFTPWPGAVLQTSTALSLWITLASVSNETTWGYLETAPADWPPIFATQDELHGGVMVVGIIGGLFLPSSVTDLDMANFANPMAVIKTNGQVEIIQYRDVAALSDGRFQLSTLRRGQRGTDTMASGHQSGEIFVFLDESLIELMAVPLEQRNVGEFYRLVTVGMIPDDADIEGFTFHGRDMMPYAPVNAERTQVGADVVLTWIRRTRIGGMMEDGTDTVPLNEVSEAYEVYLLANAAAAPGFDPTVPATYVRAYLTLTTPTLTYTAAQMAIDGFTPGTDTIYAVIYQVSAVVGRGFATLHVLPSLGGLTIGLEDGSGGWAGWLWG